MVYYENVWKGVIREAPGVGAAMHVEAGDPEPPVEPAPISREHLVQLYEWVAHKNGTVSGYKLVYDYALNEDVKALIDSHHWTGDAGTLDLAETAGLEGIDGSAMLRPEDAVPDGCVLLVDLASIRLDGSVQTREYDRTGGVTVRPYAVCTNVCPT